MQGRGLLPCDFPIFQGFGQLSFVFVQYFMWWVHLMWTMTYRARMVSKKYRNISKHEMYIFKRNSLWVIREFHVKNLECIQLESKIRRLNAHVPHLGLLLGLCNFFFCCWTPMYVEMIEVFSDCRLSSLIKRFLPLHDITQQHCFCLCIATKPI